MRLQNGRRVTSPPCATYLLIPVPWLIAAFGLLPVYSALAWRRHRLRAADRARRQCCSTCGYSLLGNTSGVCPECG
ncbi:MAG TPA: hypothetical protein VN541_16300, partial [Tepidisphaeraceae bacterium]|nr:hypothetical protein [Tepidisphaeraceae bacterium]